MRKNLVEDPKDRELQNFDLKQLLEDRVKGIDDCIVAWCQTKHIASAVPQQWETKVTQLIDDRITTLKID